MLNIRKMLIGFGLIPVTTTGIDSKGELEVRDSDGKIWYHDGTVAAPLVTEASTATYITNVNIASGAAIDASKIANGSVSNAEFQYLDGVTSAIQGQIDLKAPIASPTFTGTVSGITSTMVGLGNVDNTSDVNKPVSTAQSTAINAKVDDTAYNATSWDAITTVAPSKNAVRDEVETLITAINGKQPLDATLTALAAYNTNGILVQTAADTFAGRTITGTANQIDVTNGNGVAGNPTLALASNPIIPGTADIMIPSGTTAQRPGSPTAGMIRYNTDLGQLEGYTNAWGPIAGSGGVTNYITSGSADASTTGWRTFNWERTFTVTIAAPAVFTVASTTGMYVGMPIAFTTTGALPTGLTASTTFYVSNVLGGTTFRVSATLGGADLTTTGTQSGTHTSYPLVPINSTTVALAGLTFSTSASSPLVGLNSYTLVQTNSTKVGGEAVGYDFTIDSGYQAQPLGVSFNFNASSTFVASSGLVGSDSDIEVAVWDRTNNVLIPVTPKVITANGANNFTFGGSFQTNSNSTAYTLMLYTPTMNANATGWTFKWDNVVVGPGAVQGTTNSPGVYFNGYQDPAARWDLTSTTFADPSLATGTNALTTINSSGITVTAAASNVAGITFTPDSDNSVYLVTVYAGLFLDSPADGSIQLTDGTTVIASASNQQAGTGQQWPVSITGIYSAGSASASKTLKLQIAASTGVVRLRNLGVSTVGSIRWTITKLSNGGSSSGAGGAIFIGAQVYASGNYAVTAGNPVKYNTIVNDTTASYSTSTGLYTCPVSGFYRVSVTTAIASAAGELYISKNGATTGMFIVAFSTTGGTGGSQTVKCNAGDTLGVNSDTSNTQIALVSSNFCAAASFELVGVSSTSASANASVNARYYASATTISGSLATVNWTTKDFDSNGGMSSGTYTVPISGKYQCNAGLLIAGTIALNNSCIVELQKNGTVVSRNTEYAGGAITNQKGWIDDIVSCIAGDTLRIQVSSSATLPTIVSSNFDNYFSLARVGN